MEDVYLNYHMVFIREGNIMSKCINCKNLCQGRIGQDDKCIKNNPIIKGYPRTEHRSLFLNCIDFSEGEYTPPKKVRPITTQDYIDAQHQY